MDNDGLEDLLVSNHGQPPSLYLNQGGFFVDRSSLLPDQVISDWHGATAVDLDNDGDKDLIFAGGGMDGLGEGHINRLFKNMRMELGHLAFENITAQVGIEYQPWRTRHFLPLASPDGSMVDLYMVGLPRENCPNLYFSNRSRQSIALTPDPSLGLNRTVGSEGLDLFFDFDRDGDQDLLILKQFRPTLYERDEAGYCERDSFFPETGAIYHAAAGDLNNDGYPDLYFSAFPPELGSDNLSFDGREIHAVVRRQDGDPADHLMFQAPGSSIDIDLAQHTPNNPITGHSDIFIGPGKVHPPSRKATILAADAEGRPVIDRPGIYIWKDRGASLWHFDWSYGDNPGPYKGKITAASLNNVETEGFESQESPWTQDWILINQQGTGFERFEALGLVHDGRTRSVVVCDLNNDGWQDIAGVRGREDGRPNGTPFALINHGGLRFFSVPIMDNAEDDIFQADQLVAGFFNEDGLPDLFFTNGNGLLPGNVGPYKLFLNATPNRNDYVLLKLRGRAANRDGLGAQVELYATDGSFLGYREVGAGFNRGQSTLKVHFGLGRSESPSLLARILWPGALTWDERQVQANRLIEIVQ